MISGMERTIYERMQLPLAIFSVPGSASGSASGDASSDSMHVELISNGLCRAIGIEREASLEMLNLDLYDRVHPEDKDWLKRSFENFIHKTQGLDVFYRNRCGYDEGYRMIHSIGKWQEMQDGSRMIMIAYFEIDDPGEKLDILFSSKDSFARKDSVEHQLLYKDMVSGLQNVAYLRQFSNERLRILRACGYRPVLLYVDVKSLHEYNKQYGYEKGDELIRLYAGLLKKAFPKAMIGRGTDDHFVIIDQYTNDEDITEKITEVDRTARMNAYGNTRGIHAGICVIEPEMDISKAVDCARQSMKGIQDDLNIIWDFYSPEFDEKYWKEQYIIENLDNAIKNKWIKVFYQGIVSVSLGKKTSLEALARWIDPEMGMISPGEFIPVLSRYHLLYRLDLYMLEQICREFSVRENGGLPPIPVTVNVSAQDFDYVDVVDRFNEILKRYSLDHSDIIVEITEQDIALGTEHFKSQLELLRECGYQLWIDDFGSGYSSLNVFSQYEIDQIKFDMELIRHLDENNGVNRSILRAFIGICKERGIHTLAEGVETAEQFQFLKQIGCEMVQGFYFHRPESVEASIYRHRSIGTSSSRQSR